MTAVNIDARLENADWPKRTPDKFADLDIHTVQKWNESLHPRGKGGRWVQSAMITVGDRQIEVVKPRRAIVAGDKLVPINVIAFDTEFQRQPGFYIGVGGKDGIGNRYARFGEFIGQHNSIEAAEVTVHEDGRIGFTNGRHRYAWLRDQGLTSIPVAMTPESVKHAKKHGYLSAVKLAWDESQHLRDKEGKFTESGLIDRVGSTAWMEREPQKAQKADPATGRYVTPFVSFEKQGDESLRMIASLNSSRLATWGFTAEAEVRGMARYKLTAVLDGRTSDFCRIVDGKIFHVEDARRKVIEVLNVQNPEDLKVVQPWPKQTKQALSEFRQMTPQELTERGLHIPPYHPHCRTICRVIGSSKDEEMEEVATIPDDTEVFQAVTQADLREIGVDATPEEVAEWNAHVGMSPVELMSKLTGMPPQEVMTKGVGSTPVQFEESGNIAFHARGEIESGVAFKLGAILDPFTGIYYLTQADLLAGTPAAEVKFLKNMFSALIEMGIKSTATSVAVGVAGNAAYYAKLGFLPDELEWDVLRSYAWTELETGALKPLLASLKAEDQLLVRHLLQDQSVSALSALVDLPFSYQGKTIGEWILAETAGTWGLDLLDEALVAQARAYLV